VIKNELIRNELIKSDNELKLKVGNMFRIPSDISGTSLKRPFTA